MEIVLLVYLPLDWIHKSSRNRISYVRLNYTLYSIKYSNIILHLSGVLTGYLHVQCLQCNREFVAFPVFFLLLANGVILTKS